VELVLRFLFIGGSTRGFVILERATEQSQGRGRQAVYGERQGRVLASASGAVLDSSRAPRYQLVMAPSGYHTPQYNRQTSLLILSSHIPHQRWMKL
jgi:hypothetical protein